MSDIKELIKFLDDFISWFSKPPFLWNDKAKATLTEIKGIVEQSRQPEKLRVKREDILSVVIFISEEFPPKEEDMQMMEGLFISEGFEVTDK